MNQFFRHFLKHFTILIAFIYACSLFNDGIPPPTPSTEVVQTADWCRIISHPEDYRYFKISCRVQDTKSVPAQIQLDLDNLPKSHYWNLKIAKDSIVGPYEIVDSMQLDSTNCNSYKCNRC